MTNIRMALLSTATLLGTFPALAADLPSRKSAPVEFVRICDSYGSGFFFIPGSDTCLKVGGRVRFDSYGIVGSNRANNSDTIGYHSRANISLDARTQTAWGTVQTVVNARIQRQAGAYIAGNGINGFGGVNAINYDAAYIRWAGITAGVATNNFSSLPITFLGGGWRALNSTNIVQLAYTATFGGGFSATLAIQDRVVAASGNVLQSGGISTASPFVLPDVVGNLRVDQSWGSAFLTAAYQDIRNIAGGAIPAAQINRQVSEAGYAVSAGVVVKLPMLAKGDEFGVQFAYARGAIDYLGIGSTAMGSDNSTGSNQFGRGAIPHAPGVLNAAGNGIDLTTGYSVAGYLLHYWTPSVRQVVFGSYIKLDTPLSGFLLPVAALNKLGDITETKIGTAMIWSPVQRFDIGVELTYVRLRESNAAPLAANALGGNPVATTVGSARSGNGLTARLRLQRDF